MRQIGTGMIAVALAILFAATPGWSQSPQAFQNDMQAALMELKPMMSQDIIPEDQRKKAIAIVEKLAKKYPDYAPVYKLQGLVYIAAREGDKAIEAANKACTGDKSACKSGEMWAKDIEEAFSECIDFLSNVDACALMHSSPKMLSLYLKDRYFTNRGDQQFIGKLTKFEKSLLFLEITWASPTAPVSEGEVWPFKVNEVMKLREVNPRAEEEGWQ